jgi:hypothetical protein
MSYEQQSPADFALDHPSPMYEHHIMSRPGSQNSRMSVEMLPSSYNPSPVYRSQQQHMGMSQPKQVCFEQYSSAAGVSSNNGAGSSSSNLSRVPSASSAEDFADIFSPLKYVE